MFILVVVDSFMTKRLWIDSDVMVLVCVFHAVVDLAADDVEIRIATQHFQDLFRDDG